MKISHLFLLVVLGAGMTACRPKKKPQPKETSAVYELKDSVLTGYCGANTTADTLDIIPLGYDPILLDMHEAQSQGRILGTFEVGDQVILSLSSNRKSVLGALDLNTLCGTWLQQDSTGDGLPYLVGLELGIDHTAGVKNIREAMKWARAKREREKAAKGEEEVIGEDKAEQVDVPFYTQWRLLRGSLLLTAEKMMNQKVQKRVDTVSIRCLKRDSLVLTKTDGTPFGLFTRQKEAEKKK